MYKIIGGDQKEYGPVTLEQIAAWIRDNRANAQTLVQKEGGPWIPIGSLPEFADILPGASIPGASPMASMSSGPSVSAGGPANPPPPGYGGPLYGMGGPDPGRARELVSGPATALIVTGILCVILSIVGLVMNLTGAGFRPPPGEIPPEMQQFFQMMEQMQGPVAIVGSVINLGISILLIIAGQKMRALQSFALVVTGAILAIVPCLSPCCCIGIPVGIWALVILYKPEVKSAFQ